MLCVGPAGNETEIEAQGDGELSFKQHEGKLYVLDTAYPILVSGQLQSRVVGIFPDTWAFVPGWSFDDASESVSTSTE